jgi:hypothetical protein
MQYSMLAEMLARLKVQGACRRETSGPVATAHHSGIFMCQPEAESQRVP